LHTLNLSRAFSIDDQTLATIGSFCPNLTALNVNFCFSITDRGLVGFMRAASRDFNQELPLKQLSLANCHLVSTEGVMRSADTCPQLQYLRLTACKALDGQAFIYLLDRCKQLRYLFLTSCNQMVSDETLRDASERLNGQQLSLRYMDVSFCTEIQDLSLLQRFIGEHCPQLTSLGNFMKSY
jgi:hypothetical protein